MSDDKPRSGLFPVWVVVGSAAAVFSAGLFLGWLLA